MVEGEWQTKVLTENQWLKAQNVPIPMFCLIAPLLYCALIPTTIGEIS